MKTKFEKVNLNTEEYLDALYKTPAYTTDNGWTPVLARLKLDASLLGNYERHLDIGCADGSFTKFMLEANPDSEGFGIDISGEAVALAARNCPKGTFSKSSCYTLPFKDAEFDLVHAGEVLEHLENPELAIAQITRVLKKGGDIVITTPRMEPAPLYEEHLWQWDAKGIEELLTGFEIMYQNPSFFASIMYIRARKL